MNDLRHSPLQKYILIEWLRGQLAKASNVPMFQLQWFSDNMPLYCHMLIQNQVANVRPEGCLGYT